MAVDVDSRDPFFSDLPEKEYNLTSSRDKARKLGQFFTPYTVARFMAEWVNLSPSLMRVLDPAVGLGIFFRALLDVNPAFSGAFYGFEVDPQVLTHANQLFINFTNVKISFIPRDFLLSEDRQQYDGILANPPYLRYKFIPEREKLIDKIEQECGVTISRYSNLYVYFIVRCMQVLAPRGRAAILVPSDFLNSGFGAPLKENLIADGMLKHIILFEQKTSIFQSSTTTSCILLLENVQKQNPVSFITLSTMDDLIHLARDIQRIDQSAIPLAIVNPSALSAREKWNRYYTNTGVDNNYRNLAPITKFGRVMRGIASGNNRFFTFSRQKIAQSGIPFEFFLPCLTRSSQASLPFFTDEFFNKLVDAGKPIFLLDANLDPQHPAVKTYLAQGVAAGSHLRYLTTKRSPWYRLENRLPAPILATTFNRQTLRFVRNETGVRNLTCFHSIYLHPGMESKADLLMAYLLTPIAHSIIKRNRREYGDGLVKYEPNDLNNALVADLTDLPCSIERQALSLYSSFRRSCLQGSPHTTCIDQLDALFTDWIQPN